MSSEKPPAAGPVVNHKLRLFVTLSVIAHVVFAVGWGIPEYLRRADAKQQAQAVKLQEQKQQEQVELARDAAEKEAVEGIKEQVLEELKQDFEQLVQGDLEPAARSELWDHVVAAILADLEEYARTLADSGATDTEIRDEMVALQGEMFDEFYKRLREMTARQLADSFVATVEKDIAPKVTEHYQKQVEAKIGRRLQQEGSKIIQAEHRTVTADKQSVRNDLVAAQRHAESAERELRQAAQRIEKGKPNVEKKNPPDEAALVKKETAAVARAAESLKTAEAKLRAADKSDLYGPEIKTRIASTADEQAKRARAEVAETVVHAGAGKADETVKAAREAAEASQKLAAAAADARAMTEKADFNPVAQAKAVMKAIKDQETKAAIDVSFRENYKKHAVPRLNETLTEAFEKTLEQAGIEDQHIVEEVERKIEELLGDPVVEKVEAGQRATAPITQAEKLDEAKSQDRKNEPRAEVVAGKMRDLTGELTLEPMKSLTQDASRDDALARLPGSGAADEGLGGGNADLLHRLAAASAGLKTGRTSFGTSGGGSAMRVARLRQRSLERMQDAMRSRDPYAFDRAKHQQLTAGIHERDQAAAQGKGVDRSSSDQAASIGEAASDLARAATVLMPAPVEAQPAENTAPTEPFKPSFKSIRFAAIPFLEKVPTLDGDLSDWESIPAYPMPPLGGNRAPQQVQMAWDNAGFYFAFSVKDPDQQITYTNASTFWEGDAVEIWIDSLNTKDERRGNPWAQQFWVWPFGQKGDPTTIGGEAVKVGTNEPFKSVVFTADQLRAGASKTADGWALEVHLPLERLQKLDLEPGRIIGMNLSVCTGTSFYFYWAGTSDVRTSERPDTWGDVLLSGTQGKLEAPEKLASELAPGESAEPIRGVMIGDPLKLRVGDADMNLSSGTKDKVPVIVSTRHGDREIAILEETSEASGVFEGSLPTSLHMGDAIPGVVSLYDGETIDLLYIDQAGPDGKRDSEVKHTVPTAAAVTGLASN